ncbi:MAG: GerW family sporulation protein [Muricoprocola sp.]
MSAENNFQSKVESLFKGMDGFIHSKTVVGDAITVGDTIILPLVDVSFGVAAAAMEGREEKRNKNNGGGGMGCKMTPSAVLVIQNGTTKLVNVRNQDGLTKVLDMVPDFVNRFASAAGFTDSSADKGKESKDAQTTEDTQE